MQAIIVGATGATGTDLLNLLLADERFDSVLIFTRSLPAITHKKLKVEQIDFDQPEQWSPLIKGDVLFSCLGTTIKTAKTQQAQYKVDYEYQLSFAQAARKNGIENYVLVSALYASSSSLFFYSKMKGQLEDAVRALGFQKLIIFNPSILIRDNSNRNMEKIAAKALKIFNSFGLLTSNQPLSTQLLAKAMINTVMTFEKGTYNIEASRIASYVV